MVNILQLANKRGQQQPTGASGSYQGQNNQPQPIQQVQQPAQPTQVMSGQDNLSFYRNLKAGNIKTTPEEQKQMEQKSMPNFFKDEKVILDDMMNKGYDFDTANITIKNRRKSMLKDTKLTTDEAVMVEKMVKDPNIDTATAVEGLKEYRKLRDDKAYREMSLAGKVGKNLFDLTLGYISGIASGVGGAEEFVGSGLRKVGLETIGKSIEKTGTEYREAGALGQEIGQGKVTSGIGQFGGQLAAGYTMGSLGGKIPLGGGKTIASTVGKMGPITQQALKGAGGFAGYSIMEKGKETTPGDIATAGVTGAIAGPVLGLAGKGIMKVGQKAQKYGTAGIKGGVEGLKKSIGRDITRPIKGLQNKVAETADRLGTNINRMTKGEINSFKKEIGVTPGKFLNDRGINKTGGDLVDELSNNLKKSRQQADLGLASIKGKFKGNPQEIATGKIDPKTGTYKVETRDPIKVMLEDNLQNASSKGMSKDSLRMKELLEKYNKGGLEMKEINEAKRFLNANNKFSYFSDDVSPRKGFVTELDNTIRNWQYDTAKKMGFENLQEINRQTKAYYKLLNGITKWEEGTKGNLPIGLTDWLSFNADPSVFLAKKVVESGRVKTGALKLLNKLSGRQQVTPVKQALISNKTTNVIPNSSTSNTLVSSKLKNVNSKGLIPNSQKAIQESQKSNALANEVLQNQGNIPKLNQLGEKLGMKAEKVPLLPKTPVKTTPKTKKGIKPKAETKTKIKPKAEIQAGIDKNKALLEKMLKKKEELIKSGKWKESGMK